MSAAFNCIVSRIQKIQFFDPVVIPTIHHDTSRIPSDRALPVVTFPQLTCYALDMYWLYILPRFSFIPEQVSLPERPVRWEMSRIEFSHSTLEEACTVHVLYVYCTCTVHVLYSTCTQHWKYAQIYFKVILSRNFKLLLPCIYQYMVQNMRSASHYLWHMLTVTCFGTDVPSPGSHYKKGAQANMTV